MSKTEIIQLFLSSAFISSVISALISYFLGRKRDNNKTLFNKKLEIYSNIVHYINSHKYFISNLDTSIQKMKSLTSRVDDPKEKNKIQNDIDKNLKELINAKNILDNKVDSIKLFAPARLLGSEAVVNQLREYYSLISDHDSINEENGKIISKCVMELEQLMREDLGYSRILSKEDIWLHLEDGV